MNFIRHRLIAFKQTPCTNRSYYHLSSSYKTVIMRIFQPYYFLGVMREIIKNDLELSDSARRQAEILIIEESLKELATSIGGLIRVRATGLPVSFDAVLGFIFVIFFIVATLAWTPSLGWYTPIIVGVLDITVSLIILIGTGKYL